MKRPNKRDWPMFRFSPCNGAGTCTWCIEPFIACLLVPQRCFVSRPLTTGIHDGHALGGLFNFSIDLGINCLGSGTANTYIIHRPTGTLYSLASETATGNDPPSFTAVSAADEVAHTGVTGKPLYLWRHTECPGQYGTGCYRFSCYRSASTTRTSTVMNCHIKDASRKTHLIRPSISKWHRVSMLNATHLFALATDKTVKWLNDIAPGHVAIDVSATA